MKGVTDSVWELVSQCELYTFWWKRDDEVNIKEYQIRLNKN